MDSAMTHFLLQEIQVLDSEAKLEHSCSVLDPGYSSACGSLSPASSVDSLCLSPQAQCWSAKRVPDDSLLFIPSATETRPKPSSQSQGARRSRSRYPGHKRRSASEREKLRMRDLTKALHHLNAYLPPSLVPAGQTLTKIQTLRLTIRYIAHLSAQLEAADEAPSLPCTDLSPPGFGNQDAMATEQTAMFLPAFPYSMEEYPCLSQPDQNPCVDFSIAQTFPDGHTLQNQLLLTELSL